MQAEQTKQTHMRTNTHKNHKTATLVCSKVISSYKFKETRLSIGHKKDDSDALGSSFLIQRRQIVFQIDHIVAFLQRNLEHFETGDERSQTRQTLLAAAADADQQRVASRSFQDAVDSQHMRHGILEKHQVHRSIELVVVVQRLLQQSAQLLVVGDRQVLGVADAGRKVAVEQRLTKDKVVVVVLEGLFDGVVLNFVVEIDVALINQLVAVHAIAFVHPQSNQVGDVLATVQGGEQQTLRHN